jgi:two-component system, OmpR family, sensor kinase
MNATRPDASRPRIRLRFTLLYAATLLVVLLSAAGVLRFAIRRTLEQEFDESVRASAQLVRQFFRTEVAEYLTVEATLTHITGELVFQDRAIRIRRPDGSLFGESNTPGRAARRTTGEPMRSVRFPLDPSLAPGWEVEVDASLSNVRALQQRIDRWFGVGIPLLVLSAAFAGWWLTGRTLRPVRAMADAASRIAPASGTRLPIDHPDDELGRLGERFNALLDRLDGALAQQRQFLADAAHELRTPIARMRARVEVALLDLRAAEQGEKVIPIEQRRTTLGELERELRGVSQQVEQLLQLAQADATGDETLGPVTSLFLDDLVADELPRWLPQAQRLDVSLTVDRLEETPTRGDPLLLARLLGVLIDNALRYAGSPGVVQVSVRPDGEAARVDVDDNGAGVPPQERDRVFDRFYRGADARVRRADGSGLGLAIADWIVRRHGGRIDVGDSPLGGARFSVRLPPG